MNANPVLVELSRAGHVESWHRGAVAVVDADGGLRLALGDIDRPVFPRSAVKALQALPLVASGAADAFGLSDAQLALACASHNGEPRHVTAARAMLAQAGLDEAALECGTHAPRQEAVLWALARSGQAPSPLHNNCSGKHAGFVCLGCLMAGAAGADPRAFVRGYVAADHPVMREVSAAIGAVCGWNMAAAPRATDGCSIPTYAMALSALARGFARFGSGVHLSPDHAAASRRLRQAVAAAPEMVGGQGRFDSRVMAHFGPRVFCKVGAEGVYTAALPERGLGVALKMDDGATARAAEVAMAALLQRLLAATDADDALLATLADAPQLNWNGREVGRLRATPALCTA